MSILDLDSQKRSPGFQKFMEEEKRKQDARAAALLAPAQQALRQANREKQNIWRTTPVEKWTKTNDLEYLAAVTPDLELEVAPSGFFDDTEAATMKGREARVFLDNFLKTLPQTRGIVLSLSDQKKFRFLVSAFVKTKDAVVTSDNLNRIFDWAVQGETIFNDFGYDETLVEQPESETAPPSVDDILSKVDTTTRSGTEILRQAVENSFLDEYREVVMSWHTSLARDWNVVPTQSEWDFLMNPRTGYFVQRNLPFGENSSFDKARVMMARTNRWKDAWTAQEWCDEQLAKGLMTYPEYIAKFNELSRIGKWTRPKADSGL
jgi:hypothetical protein